MALLAGGLVNYLLSKNWGSSGEVVREELGLVTELKELNTKSREELAELKELNVTMKALLETLSKN